MKVYRATVIDKVGSPTTVSRAISYIRQPSDPNECSCYKGRDF